MNQEYIDKLNSKERSRKKKREFPDFWVNRGYLPHAAEQLAWKSFSNTLSEQELADTKICTTWSRNFWTIRGYSEKEANQEVASRQSKNCSKWLTKYSKEERQEQSNTSLQFYLNKGMTEEEAKKALSTRQSTFSLDKCIEKYGIEEGTKKWKDRQDRWQATLNDKTEEEINDINRRKDARSMEWALKKTNGNLEDARKLRQDLIEKTTNKLPFISKESIRFFLPIITWIQNEFGNVKYYGVDTSEFFLRSGNSIFFYDFYLPDIKLCVEYHGIAFHPKEGQIDWKSPFGHEYESSFIREQTKAKRLTDNNIECIIVWSDSDLDYETCEIKRIIYEKYQNFFKTIV